MASRDGCLKWLAISVGVALIAALGFSLFPRLDLAISDWFSIDNVPFPFRDMPVWKAVRELMIALTDGFMLVLISLLILGTILPSLRLVRPRVLAFVVFVYLMVPGVIVNGLLKEHWGRARPRNVLEFGGQAQFTSALQLSDQCTGSCSFVSGEASALFTIAVLAVLIVVPQLARRKRTAATGLILATATFKSALRMAFGAHFFSDVLFAALISTTMTLALYVLFGMDRMPGPLIPRRPAGTLKNL